MSYEPWLEPEDSPFDAAIEAGWIDPVDLSKAMIDVMNERDRQWNEEGFDPEHDDKHMGGELLKAGLCYAWGGMINLKAFRHRDFTISEWFSYRFLHSNWPWDRAWWKPGAVRRMLVKAAALLIAEIERIDRAEAKGNTP